VLVIDGAQRDVELVRFLACKLNEKVKLFSRELLFATKGAKIIARFHTSEYWFPASSRMKPLHSQCHVWKHSKHIVLARFLGVVSGTNGCLDKIWTDWNSQLMELRTIKYCQFARHS
jgi:hypothetical protein